MKKLIFLSILGCLNLVSCGEEKEDPKGAKPFDFRDENASKGDPLDKKSTKEYAEGSIQESWAGNSDQGKKDEELFGNWDLIKGSRCLEYVTADRLSQHMLSFKPELSCAYLEVEREFDCAWTTDKSGRFLRIQRRLENNRIRALTVKYWIREASLEMTYNGIQESFTCRYRRRG